MFSIDPPVPATPHPSLDLHFLCHLLGKIVFSFLNLMQSRLDPGRHATGRCQSPSWMGVLVLGARVLLCQQGHST